MNIVLLGAPGCGKGYISNLLIGEYKFKHISTGNLLRENIKNQTELGKQIEKYMAGGDLVPDELVLSVLKQALEDNKDATGIIFDGYPRRVEQAIQLDKLINIDIVVNIEVPKEVILDRLSTRRVCSNCSEVYNVKTYSKNTCEKCGRAVIQRDDDVPSVIQNRLIKYEEQTKPLIDFYKQQGKLVGVSNSGDSNQTFTLLKDIINKY